MQHNTTNLAVTIQPFKSFQSSWSYDMTLGVEFLFIFILAQYTSGKDSNVTSIRVVEHKVGRCTLSMVVFLVSSITGYHPENKTPLTNYTIF